MLKEVRRKFCIFLAAFLCPTMLNAQNNDIKTTQFQTLRAQENKYIIEAFKAARNGDESLMNNNIEKLIDKSLKPIIIREYIFAKAIPNQSIIENWLLNYSHLNGAQTIYEIGQRLGFKNLKKPVDLKGNIQKTKLEQPVSKNIEKSPNAKPNELIELNKIISSFHKADDEVTIALALKQLNGGYAGKAAWYGGLSAFRSKDYQTALILFSLVSHWQFSNDYTKSEGAFWAARCANILNDFESEEYYLNLAGKIPLSFYGQLAIMKLGNWKSLAIPSINDETKAARKLVNENENIKNALWLFEIGEVKLSQDEFEYSWQVSKNENDIAYYYIANALGFAQISSAIAKNNNFSQIIQSYPIIDIKPNGGDYVLDRALIFAIMRQESRFKPNAISYAGARGLMQLMPSTAAWLSKSPQIKANPAILHNNEINVTIGENYLEYVLSLNVVNNSIARALMAYNAGPGNLNFWLKRIKADDDALMFIEANPNNQTRDYVKKVMTNLWIYHKRLGQNAPSLEKLANFKSPDYEPQDNPRQKYSQKMVNSSNAN